MDENVTTDQLMKMQSPNAQPCGCCDHMQLEVSIKNLQTDDPSAPMRTDKMYIFVVCAVGTVALYVWCATFGVFRTT